MRRAGLVGAVTAAWGTWLAIAGRVTPAELAVGAMASAVVVALADFDRRAAGAHLALPRGWWRGLVGLPRDVARDVGTVTAALARTAAGRPVGSGYATVDVAGRGPHELAVAIVTATVTPNTLVVGYDPDGEVLLVHQLRLSDQPDADVRARLP